VLLLDDAVDARLQRAGTNSQGNIKNTEFAHIQKSHPGIFLMKKCQMGWIQADLSTQMHARLQ
jgi:hypothetical protein